MELENGTRRAQIPRKPLDPLISWIVTQSLIYINSYFLSCSMGRKSSNKQTHEGDCNIPLFAPVGVGVVVGVRVGVGVVCRGGGGGGGRGSPTQKIGGNVYQGLGYDPGCRRVQGFPRDLRSPSAISRN